MTQIFIDSLKHQLETLDFEMLDLLRRREQLQTELHNHESFVSFDDCVNYLKDEIDHQCLDAEKMKNIWKEIYK